MFDAVTGLNPALVVFALLGLVLLIQAMLLKLGLMKPGWQGAQTVLGNTLLGLGFLWYGASEMVLGLSGTANGVSLTIFALPEQQDIVSFLDVKTSLIDEIIEGTMKRIHLLKELRSSLISEVVTKGLDSEVDVETFLTGLRFE